MIQLIKLPVIQCLIDSFVVSRIYYYNHCVPPCYRYAISVGFFFVAFNTFHTNLENDSLLLKLITLTVWLNIFSHVVKRILLQFCYLEFINLCTHNVFGCYLRLTVSRKTACFCPTVSHKIVYFYPSSQNSNKVLMRIFKLFLWVNAVVILN